jgi:hypothetical protein
MIGAIQKPHGLVNPASKYFGPGARLDCSGGEIEEIAAARQNFSGIHWLAPALVSIGALVTAGTI